MGRSAGFVRLSRNFVCVRLYYTARGASAPFAAFGLGDPRGPRNNVDLAFLAPDGRNVDVRTLETVRGPGKEGIWVRDVGASPKNAAGNGRTIIQKVLELMPQISRRFPPRKGTLAVPWQVSLSHGIFVSAWDTKGAKKSGAPPRRIVIVPAPGGKVDPDLEKALENPRALRVFEPYYVFIKLDPEKAPPELADALGRAGPKGLVFLEAARSVNGFGERQDPGIRKYPKVLDAHPGPHSRSSVARLLRKHVQSK